MAFVGADEPRYARVSEEMWHSGDYIVPTLHGKPWLEKPPLYYWLAAACYSAFGVGEATARLPSVLAAALSILLLWWVVRKLQNEEAAFFAALTASTSPLFFSFSRGASTDSLFSAFLSVGLLLYLYGLLHNRVWPYLASGAAIGLSTLTKGPVALLLAVMVVTPVLVFCPSAERFRRTMLSLLICLAVAAPWYWLIINRTGFEFILVFVLNHNLARFFTTLHHHEQPFYYYLLVLILGMYPWTWMVLWSGKEVWRQLRKRGIRNSSVGTGHWSLEPRFIFIGSWIALPLLFFSASQSKLPAYVLPLVVPLSLATSLLLPAMTENNSKRTRRVVFGTLVAGSLVMAAAAIIGLGSVYDTAPLGIVLGFFLVLGSCLAYLLARRSISSALVALAGSNVAAALLVIVAVLPVVEPYFSARYVVQRVLPRLPPNEPLYQYRTFHHTVDYYSGGRAIGESIQDWWQLRRALLSHSPLWVIAETVEVPLLQSEADLQVQVLESRGTWSAVKVSWKGREGWLGRRQ